MSLVRLEQKIRGVYFSFLVAPGNVSNQLTYLSAPETGRQEPSDEENQAPSREW
jgi:hypothetical protein